ncbi:MAG: Fic/DOC family N-terminal domain-containing protein, partial [Bacilli bacterium]|nr:Fic/DOC family N-terminal domain-containing protein [Bacilli bacterium]
MYKLPMDVDLNRVDVLKKLSSASSKLGELKGLVKLLPNPNIILNAITLGEAKDSSEIENIFTTYDELYKEMITVVNNPHAKEVVNYRTSIFKGFDLIKNNNFISTNILIEIQRTIEPQKSGIRKLPGTVIKNSKTGEIVHTPPQSEIEIRDYLTNLENYINYDLDDYDPLIKLAIIHYQFEQIHPFYDGNGRTGRVLNILYLVLKDKLDLPILYLSRYIINNKGEYYSLLKKIDEDKNKIVDFVIYILEGIEETAGLTINFINQINNSIISTNKLLKEKLPKIYSDKLVNLIYYEFYTKNAYVQKELNVKRLTAMKYLHLLEENGFLVSE